MKKILLVLSVFSIIILAMAMMPAADDPTLKYHTPEEIASFSKHEMAQLDSFEYFHKSRVCQGCHGFDTLALANVDSFGNDINLFDDWQTSMMALSAVDPFWRAKVRQEVLINPAHSNELQTLCTSCHAPMGHYTAIYKGQPHYTLADLTTDSLGIGGVGCMGCHAIGPNGLGSMFTGNIPYDTNHVEYGPFDLPQTGPMQLYVGITPVKGDHVSEGRMCSSCHTLISNAVDLSGNPTGTTFVEQATYHEWENSNYPGSEITCQTCHMPQIDDPIKIANGYIGLPGRSPFNLHSFAGANSFMVNLIKTNKSSLGVTAPDANFDSTLFAINKLLTRHAVNVNATLDSITTDTAYASVTLTNKAGHKFPSGYPSRRAVLQLIATKQNGDSLFSSGIFSNNGEVASIDSVFEPHYNTINDESQVQVYEMVMGDVNGDKTTVLERAYSHLKDNRIPPEGFSTLNSTYDTCAIYGNALTDSDFNYISGVEGSGADVVHYSIPLKGYNGTLSISASLYYQTLPPSFLTEMFNFSAAEIDSFQNYYSAADHTPVLVGRDTLLNINVPVGIADNSLNELMIFPSITTDGIIYIKGIKQAGTIVTIYNQSGRLLFAQKLTDNRNELKLTLPATSGIYYIQAINQKQKSIKKILRL